MRNLRPESPLLLAGGHARVLSADWSLAGTIAGTARDPEHLATFSLDWIPAIVPGTVAQSLAAVGRWSIERDENIDDRDWWYRVAFGHEIGRDTRAGLVFHGLATLAEVWLNGQQVLTAANMFQRYAPEVAEMLERENELVICFRSLSAELAKRRPRPRWKTRLVAQQQLRWFRTTLLGRIPGWTPPAAPVGPFRPVELQQRGIGSISECTLRASLEGDAGFVQLAAHVAAGTGATVSAALTVAGNSAELRVEPDGDAWRISGRLQVPRPALWWPHTHGDPIRHDCSLRVTVDGDSVVHECGQIGFRSVVAVRDDGGFEIQVNGTRVFCRGACWTSIDVVSLGGSDDELRRTLTLLRDAGANMLRIGGTMTYERDAFYALCDELGIMVWQDFMFANMDYPADDAAFVDSVHDEATQQVARLAGHPCLAVWCGNSEVEQQAAMLGMPPEIWRSRLFAEVLPDVCARLDPGTPYVPSTPSGAGLPFGTSTGVTHYYGVGAYLRPVSDARRSQVRFTPECLAFANVPEPEIVNLVMQNEAPATHDPRWKRRVPRDSGAGWDFEDVRDHYVAGLFDVDPVRLRSSDSARYLDFGRVATGEIMSQVFAEWRSARSMCGGGLVWFARDLWPGAGWGILDSRGMPKACYYYLRRAWQPQTVLLTDEGLDGVVAHVVNDSDSALDASLEVMLLRDGKVVAAQGSARSDAAARGAATVSCESVLGGFHDTAYAYRFGPVGYEVLVATLRDSVDTIIGEAFHFPVAGEPREAVNATVSADAARTSADEWRVTVSSDAFLYAARLDVPGFVAEDNYFHLVPGRAKAIDLRAVAGEGAALRGHVEALNLRDAVRIDVRA